MLIDKQDTGRNRKQAEITQLQNQDHDTLSEFLCSRDGQDTRSANLYCPRHKQLAFKCIHSTSVRSNAMSARWHKVIKGPLKISLVVLRSSAQPGKKKLYKVFCFREISKLKKNKSHDFIRVITAWAWRLFILLGSTEFTKTLPRDLLGKRDLTRIHHFTISAHSWSESISHPRLFICSCFSLI